jgi:hypothetical protein
MLNEWEELPPMIHKRAGAAVALIGQHIYVVGGVGDSNVVCAFVERFNFVEYSRSMDDAAAAAGQGGAGAGIAVLEELENARLEHALGEGGGGGGGGDASVWEEVAPMREPRTDFAMASMGGKLYAVSGDTTGTGRKGYLTPDVEVYDPFTNEWTTMEQHGTTSANFPGEHQVNCLHTGRCYNSAVTLRIPRHEAVESVLNGLPSNGGAPGFYNIHDDNSVGSDSDGDGLSDDSGESY